MTPSFFFYDLETSGFSPRSARIMQFAGQRTDLDLNPVGEPVNVLIKLSPDVLPEPDAVLLTGITPQQTIAEGISEAEFTQLFNSEVVKPDTIFVGFNSVRFDDEFMRFTLYRNFSDAYSWQWKDGCSRWDILDVTRMTRALRPGGIKWPFASDGKPANRLEFLTSVNKISHVGAHDALSDVQATIAFARLLKTKQGDLFKYLLSIRGKKDVKRLIDKNEPFVYTSSHYPSEFMHTSAAIKLVDSPSPDASLVYDLRYDPTPFAKMSVQEIINAWQYSKDPDHVRLPIKTVKYNRVPAIAPLGVISDGASQANIKLSLETIKTNLKLLNDCKDELTRKVLKATENMDEARAKDQASLIENDITVDEKLYDGFFDSADVALMRSVQTTKPEDLNSDHLDFKDNRLKQLLPLYKARNYPKVLSDEERKAYDAFCKTKLTSGGDSSRLANYFSRLEQLGGNNVTKPERYLLEELLLYAQSLMP
jgi:exodeoxyribonuclease-1